ncbi:hypothetical protein CEK26_006642 [Fusarium fujikuroi]|uniref:Uncharacterized protein n=1 Tax=Fusarium fujikuroi TaxID=5127 RepID=A0A5Q3EL95_FUSFU|nr:hypothetical protein CEK27_006651 [Fusarium fujikuroi]QGI79847.1 hypothetical protein CEK25_006576 [Fusarium fujikuroi]QGI93573.1 hypothetical protein CEK26_006642 [Fusarium fujikuroi]VTT60997.1 unnamed protein product [Fusarium fujikuroi]VTT63693.1 unnamed protein product [Fusarium fujikuroi]
MAALLSFAPPSRYLPSIWGDFDDVELVQHECGERFRVSLCDLQLILHPFKPNIVKQLEEERVLARTLRCALKLYRIFRPGDATCRSGVMPIEPSLWSTIERDAR